MSMSPELEKFTKVWGDSYLATDVGPSLSCSEVEALASLFISLEMDDDAEMWIKAHAESDDEGDMHFEDGALVDECQAPA